MSQPKTNKPKCAYAWVSSLYFVGMEPAWKYQAKCECGWRGTETTNRGQADTEANLHSEGR